MVKILICGFKHSGTTLLQQLIKSHPQVGEIEFEKALIEYDKPLQWILDQASQSGINLKKQAWGEKLPWGVRDNDWKAKRAISFTKKWLRYFKKSARVLHILRNPIDVSLSRYPLQNMQSNDKIDTVMLKYYINSVPYYLKFIKDNLYCATVIYEDLLLEPNKILLSIFDFLNLHKSPKIIKDIISKNSIDKTRAFAYRKKGIIYDIDEYEKLFELIGRRL